MTDKQQAFVFTQYNLTHQEAFKPFIYTDLLVTYAGEQQQPIFHLWTMTNEIILGMQDTRVLDLKKGVDRIAAHGYHTVVRNSGGLAVVADEGILNISLIIPQPETGQLAINDGYELMKEVIEHTINRPDISIDAFEVTDSYCPGEFDLSINGKKFAGISQRRVKNGLAVMIYLSLTGDQLNRGMIVRDFYQESLGDSFGLKPFPPVNPHSMANLSDLINEQLTVDLFVPRFLENLENSYELIHQETDTIHQLFTDVEYEKQMERMTKRNHALTFEEGGHSSVTE